MRSAMGKGKTVGLVVLVLGFAWSAEARELELAVQAPETIYLGVPQTLAVQLDDPEAELLIELQPPGRPQDTVVLHQAPVPQGTGRRDGVGYSANGRHPP